jgi:pentatricopeptide repeat protein
MKAAKVPADTMAYSALIRTFEQNGRWMEAMEVFREMQMAGVEASTLTFNALLRTCVRGERPVLSHAQHTH